MAIRSKKIHLVIALLVSFLSVGCVKQEPFTQTPETNLSVPDSQEDAESPGSVYIAEGYDVIGGSWQVDAVYYQGRWVELSSYEALASLYDTTFLFVNEDGNYTYCRSYFQEGQYVKKSDTTYILKDEYSYRYDFVDGELVEVESTDDTKTNYLVTVIEDGNALRIAEFNAMTGQEVNDDMPLRLVRMAKDDIEMETESYPETSARNEYNSPSYQGGSSRERNALEEARSYLRYSAFSYEGLIEQLEYEGYSYSEAKYGADNCGANWNEQALKSAQSYLKHSAFSYSGLAEQLEYEGFTSSQANYGVDNCNADWYEQAVKSAKQYLKYSSFSRTELIDQLEYEGFTYDQAVYGVNKAY